MILTSEWPYEWMEEYVVHRVDDFIHYIDDDQIESLNFYQDEHDKYEILWHEPQQRDVFRVAKENWEDMFMWSESLLFSPDIRKIYVPYNPTLPLISQTEETKLAIISLFS